MSQPGNSGAFLNISRSRRFILFLTTALPTRRPTAKPHLVKSSPLGKALTTISLPAQDLPLL
jgi:hypothetical protein